ncbi:MAG: LysM peptidoglycan-binding domain-containing protein [Chloroflexota bacterium]
MNLRFFLTVIALLVMALGCTAEPQQIEVTRDVLREVPVTIEVTRVVTEIETVEVAVETTRLVAVVVTATPESTETAVAATVEAEPTPEPTATTPAGSTYTIRAGDNLSLIARKTGTAVETILAANNLTTNSILVVGQELTIPGWDGVEQAVVAAATPVAPAAPTAAPPAAEPVVQGPNLLPNPSFEGDWYFYLYNELQIPDGWQLTTDEGPVNLEPGAPGNFFRPEVRVVPRPDLPAHEQNLFIFDGDKTVKAFKGGAPTSFSLFTDLVLQPGSYRLTVRYFPDTVAGYSGNQKIFAGDPLAAEVRIIHNNGGTGWQGSNIGQHNTRTYDFTVTEAGTVRLGASFRNRFVMANNGWFIDHWSLYALSEQ